MAKRKDDGSGHPFFWLLLGFLCGVVGTLGALLLLSSDVTGPGSSPTSPDAIGHVPLAGASSPETATPPPTPQVTARGQVPVPPVEALDHPKPPVFETAKPAPPRPVAPAPIPGAVKRPAAPAQSRSQIDEDAAASGLTSRTR